MGAPDGEQAESNGMATFTQTLKHCTHIHTNLKQIRGGGVQLLQRVFKQTVLPIND